MGTSEGKRRRVFLSSTRVDLAHDRFVAALVLETLGFDVERMERFGADDPPPWVTCERAVGESDLMLLLVGNEYGAIVPDGTKFSYTEQEYETARRRHIPVYPLVHAGFDHATSDPRLARFVRKLEAAHTIPRSSFTLGDGDSLKRLIETTFANVDPNANPAGPAPAEEALSRPFFSRERPAGIDISYAIGRVRREVLERDPYRVYLAYTRVAGNERFPHGTADRLLRKGAELHRTLEEQGIDVRFFNDLRVRGVNDAARVAARVAKLARRASLTICIVHDQDDYGVVDGFASAGALAVVAPAALAIPQEGRLGDFWVEYAQDEIESCGVTTRTAAHVRDCLDQHLIERFE